MLWILIRMQNRRVYCLRARLRLFISSLAQPLPALAFPYTLILLLHYTSPNKEKVYVDLETDTLSTFPYPIFMYSY